ncbi:hypothetical protein CLV84_2944 [Neolewinella xylanilytica]|uniref:Uncharacterized protein n=1 Tax=Neolewinella xylanilytica TaxID=1514080 RepID=A0A2S6I4B9_9BACT|nr:hypothetical protein CLV84_2944 [Neolewinella xylanilytica]
MHTVLALEAGSEGSISLPAFFLGPLAGETEDVEKVYPLAPS